MADPDFFTVVGNYLSLDGLQDWSATNPDTKVVNGFVLFSPLFNVGDTVQALSMTPPTNLLLRTVGARITDGKIMRDGVEEGCRLVANTDVLQLDGDLFYRVEFLDTTDADGTPVVLKSFDFVAEPSPTRSSTW